MIENFLGTLVSVLTYQAIGVALFLPLELAFPKVCIPFKDRAGGLIFLLALAPITAAVAALMMGLSHALGIKPIPFHFGFWTPVVAAIVGALWLDLQFYVVHRLEHRFFWRFHAVHHSIRNLSAVNSYHHWTEPLMGVVTIGIPLMFVDVQIGPGLGVLTFLFRYQQFYIHSASRPNFGPLRWLLVDNRYHRIHHSMQPEHYDKNFGAMSPLWDWVFGTLHMPAKGEWPEVGLNEIDEPQSLREWSSAPWRISSVGDRGRGEPGSPQSGVGDFYSPDVGGDVAGGRVERVGADV